MNNKNNKQQSNLNKIGKKQLSGDTTPPPMFLHEQPVAGFDPPSKLYITSIFNQYAGKRDQALADLQIYLGNPVGIGEHADIGEEIKRKIEEVDKYTSLVETIQNQILRQNSSEEQQQQQQQQQQDLGPEPSE
jgi:hypothetical protein